MAINFPLRTAFAVSLPGMLKLPFYLIHDPLIIEQCGVQLPIISIFSAVVFVVEF
jgi:hypothetical protein